MESAGRVILFNRRDTEYIKYLEFMLFDFAELQCNAVCINIL
jgi:hypothetical protein